MLPVKTEAAPYLELWRARHDDAEPDFLRSLRVRAARRFGELGFPTRRDEAWRFNDLRPLASERFAVADPDLVTGASEAYKLGVESRRLVLVNGRVSPELSRLGALPPGVFIGSLAEALARIPEQVGAHLDQGEGE